MKWDVPLPGDGTCTIAITGNIGFIKYPDRDGRLYQRQNNEWRPWHPSQVYGEYYDSCALSDALLVSYGTKPQAHNSVLNALYPKYLESIMTNEQMR